MVNPVNGDKPISTSADRGSPTRETQRAEAATGKTAAKDSSANTTLSDSVTVENARQLYNLEANKPDGSTARVTTSEQANSLLNELSVQAKAKPEQFFSTQTANINSSLASLLEAGS